MNVDESSCVYAAYVMTSQDSSNLGGLRSTTSIAWLESCTDQMLIFRSSAIRNLSYSVDVEIEFT